MILIIFAFFLPLLDQKCIVLRSKDANTLQLTTFTLLVVFILNQLLDLGSVSSVCKDFLGAKQQRFVRQSFGLYVVSPVDDVVIFFAELLLKQFS